MSALLLCLMALASSVSRGLISVIDRFQMGVKKQDITIVNFKNNFYTFGLATLLAIIFLKQDVWSMLLDYKIMLYALLVQAVAIGYSYLFKSLTVAESVVASKFSDLLIPIALFASSGSFSASSYVISILTTVIVFTLMITKYDRNIWSGIAIITPLLVSQSVLSPILTSGYSVTTDRLLAFTYCTIVFRLLIVLLMLLTKKTSLRGLKSQNTESSLKEGLIYLTRTILTLVAQIGFTFATSGHSSLAWILLNITSLYGVVFSSFILKEKLNTKAIVALVLVSGLTVIKAYFG
ncbi:hypothetical protein R4Y45_06345 [Holzapfeliella sp. He02]|uniref:EamA domain-containing protein n=1 Tax=Holzapfeliella saturejae TaxID=3082953 RepID=A0ABU8SHH4_9LACO